MRKQKREKFIHITSKDMKTIDLTDKLISNLQIKKFNQ